MARRSSRFPRSTRKATDWTATTAETALVAVAGSSQSILHTFSSRPAGEIIIRIRGLVGIATDQIAAAELQLGAIGIGVVSAQAAALGITAVPHPDTDASWGGWMWHTYYAERFSESGTGLGFDVVRKYVIDSKAMRKVGDEERMIMVIENSAATGILLYTAFRVLSKAQGA